MHKKKSKILCKFTRRKCLIFNKLEVIMNLRCKGLHTARGKGLG